MWSVATILVITFLKTQESSINTNFNVTLRLNILKKQETSE